jgi:hypothetical protein
VFTCLTFMSAECFFSPRLMKGTLGAVFAWISCFGGGGVGETLFFDEGEVWY